MPPDFHYYFAEKQSQEPVKSTSEIKSRNENEKEVNPHISCSKELYCSINGPECFLNRTCGLQFSKERPHRAYHSTAPITSMEELEWVLDKTCKKE